MQSTTFRRALNRIFLCSSLTIALVACKKDKDKPNGPDPLPDNAKLVQYSNGEDFIRFIYNTDGTVKKVLLRTDLNTGGDEVEYTVTYNAQKKIAAVESQWQKIEPEYDANKVLIRAKMYSDNQMTGYTNYHFVNGNLQEAVIYSGESGTYSPLLSYSMSYTAQGNVDEMVILIANGEPDHLERAGHVEYQYDQKTNPLYAHRELLALFMQSVSKNNISVENHFDGELQPDDKYVYTYTYKANGLPEKATVKQGLPGQDPVTTQLTFTYQ